MSYVQLRAGLLQSLIDCINQYNTDNGENVGIGFQNKTFDPSDYDTFVNCSIIPATSEALGKTDADGDDRRGIFQVSAFVESNASDYDIGQFTLIDYIVAWFKYNSQHGIAMITSQTVNDGRGQEGWFVRDISINYLTFVNRG